MNIELFTLPLGIAVGISLLVKILREIMTALNDGYDQPRVPNYFKETTNAHFVPKPKEKKDRCEYCGTKSKPEDDRCKSCGAPLA